jgi:hypothetical protein
MFKALVVIIPLVLAIYCLVQVAQSRSNQVRTFPKWAWLVLIVLFPLLGSIAWLWVGRPQGRRQPPPPRRNRPVAPDDDPDFLRGLRSDKPREPRDKPHDKPDDSR